MKLIGSAARPGAEKPRVITKPTSLLAMSWLLAEFIRNDPFSAEARLPEDVAAEIPVTHFLAENENSAVMRLGNGYIYSQKSSKWIRLPKSEEVPPGVIPSPADFRKAAK